MALGANATPLPQRDGVVVSWQPVSRSTVIVTDDSRVYVVHGLRRTAPGRRVRVDGIKWGTPTSGIKWSTRPQGIKWGIRTAANRTFSSSVTRLGRTRTMALRARVLKRFGTRGVVVAVPGATVALPLVRGAVWLPTGKRSHAGRGVGAPGSTSVFRLAVTPRGRVVVTSAVEVAAARPTTPLPFAGRVTAIDPATRTITVTAGTTAFLVRVVVAVPPTVPISPFVPGAVVSGSLLAGDRSLTEISLNGSFSQADATATVVTATTGSSVTGTPGTSVGTTGGTSPTGGVSTTPTAPGGTGSGGPSPATLVTAMSTAWAAGRDAGVFSQGAGTGFATSQANRLTRIGEYLAVGDLVDARLEAQRFESLLQDAATEPGDHGPVVITSGSFKAAMLTDAAALRRALA